MNEFLTARDAVARLVEIRRSDIDLVKVLRQFTPTHAHWRDVTLPGGERFEVKPDLDRWLQGATPDWQPSKSYPAYFREHGIYGRIVAPIWALMAAYSHAKLPEVVVYPKPEDPLWDPVNTARLFPEIDFKIEFCYPDNLDLFSEILSEARLGVFINATRVSVEEERFRVHLVGVPMVGADGKVVTIVNGQGYFKRVEDFLKSKGIESGVEGLVLTEQSSRLITAFEEARIAA